MKEETKRILAKNIFQLANIGLGAILFGQFIAERQFRSIELGFALAVSILLYGIGYWLLESEKWRKVKKRR